jgi:Tfp pilus assembly protein PilO
MNVKSPLWIAVALIACVGIVVLGWFSGAAPQLAAATAASDQQVTVVAQNTAHAHRIKTLEAEFRDLGATSAELTALRLEVPMVADAPDLHNEFTDLAARHSVTITQYAVTEAVVPVALQLTAVPPVAAATPAAGAAASGSAGSGSAGSGSAGSTSTGSSTSTPTPTAGAATSGTATTPAAGSGTGAATGGSASADSTPTSLLTAGNLFAMPVNLTMQGSASDVLAFINDLQSGTRLFLVTSATVANGDLSKVAGFAFVVTGSAPTAAVTPSGVVN